jgi:hypothetical protein
MPIQLTCPQCHRTLTVSKNDAGKAAMCNACGQRIDIPLVSPLLPEFDVGRLPQVARSPENPLPNPVHAVATPVAPTPGLARERASSGWGWAIGSIAIVAFAVIAWGGWHFLQKPGPSWEVEHRTEILAMIDSAEGSVIAGDLPAAARKFRGVDALVGDHAITDSSLRRALDGAFSEKKKVLEALVDRAATRPVTARSDLHAPAQPEARPLAIVPKPVQSAVTEAPLPAAEHKAEPTVDLSSQPKIYSSPLRIAPQPVAVDAMSDERIGAAIQKGVDWMISRFDPKTFQIRTDVGTEAGVHAGVDALSVYALLQCGMAIHDERLDIHKSFMTGALTALDTLPLDRSYMTYERALRATALALYDRKEDRKVMVSDVSWLLKAHHRGAYSYSETKTPDNWDNSNSQYGLLGVWSGAEAGMEVTSGYWGAVQKHWIDCQGRDGAWGYSAGSERLSMTLAGLASLFVCHDYLDSPTSSGNVGRPPFSPAQAKGLDWLEKGDRILEEDGGDSIWWGYTLYGVERVGLASGFKFFGKHDWYRERGRTALDMQLANGSWGDNEIATAYALLFLARGRHPILMNKLRFDGAWANRPRDVANLARFATRELERPLNFQVVSVEREWTDWTDSPVLYLSSHADPKLTDGQVTSIRKFIEAGGLLFTQADGGQAGFDQFAKELAARLFPMYPMQPVPKDHLVYSMLYKVDPPPPLMMVSNGSRALMIHSSQDLSMAWQQRMDKSRPAIFHLGINIFLYAAGKTDLRNRTSSSILPEPPKAEGGTVKVARLRYSGAWDPEPAAWLRFGRWFQQQTGCGVEVAAVDLEALKVADGAIAHLTGTAPFTPTGPQAAAVRAYVDGGGTLLIDATGGSGEFTASTITLLAKAFPDASLKKMPMTHLLFSAASPGMVPLENPPPLRSLAITQLGKNAGIFEMLHQGKGRVVATSMDLTSGLLSLHTWGILGFSNGYSQSFTKNLLLWVAAGAPEELTKK